MPPEATLPRAPAPPAGVPQAWRSPLLQLMAAWAGLMGLAWNDWTEMARQWWTASTYNHILLVPPILAWLVRLRWPELRQLVPQAWWPGLVWLSGGLLAWLGGTAAGINLVSHVGSVMLLQGAAVTLLGPRVTAGLLFPLAYMLFLVPFGDEIVPALQTVTATLAVALTHASGVPATIDGVFIDTPAGLFEVAEACSGVKFLVAMVALGTLVAHLCFARWRRRVMFMAAAAVVPVLANGVRAWGTIYIAQSQGIEFAAGFDHIVYGWIFFAAVMAAVLGTAWRSFDRSPDDPLISANALATSATLTRLARFDFGFGGWHATTAILLLTVAVVWMDRLAHVP